MTTLTVRYRVVLDGQDQQAFERRMEISADSLSPDGSFKGVATVSWDEPPVRYQKGITARWVGGALNVPFHVPPRMAAKALQEGLPLVSDVVLPLTVDFREGKEFVRDGEGRAEGVIDTTFAEVTWDYAELDVVR